MNIKDKFLLVEIIAGIVISVALILLLSGCNYHGNRDIIRELEVKVALQNVLIEVQDKAIKDLTKLVKKIEVDLASIPRWSRLPPKIEE